MIGILYPSQTHHWFIYSTNLRKIFFFFFFCNGLPL